MLVYREPLSSIFISFKKGGGGLLELENVWQGIWDLDDFWSSSTSSEALAGVDTVIATKYLSFQRMSKTETMQYYVINIH